MVILKIRENKFFKTTVFLLIAQLLTETLGLNYALAGDGGPTQPEVHSFEPIGTTQMVDPFTGDFTYNIPLFNLPGPNGGYPVNLAYHSGVQMDQEASWVGLGWNINMGTISRQVRNLPDDFDGDDVKIKTDQKPNWTVSTGQKAQFEFIGISPQEAVPTISAGMNYYYNNYRGFGYSTDFGLSLKLRKINEDNSGSKLAGDLGFNIKLDSRDGVNGNVTLGISQMEELFNTTKKSLSVSTGFDRNGWQRTINIQGLADVKRLKKNREFGTGSITGGNSLSFAQPLIAITVPQAMKGGNGASNFSLGFNTPGAFAKMSFLVSYELTKLKNKNKEVTYSGIGYLYFQDQGSPEPEDDRRVKDISTENDGLVHKDTRRLAIPTLTYDNYSVTGQGIGNSFRPHRTDIGNAETPYIHSEFHGGNLGVEVAIPNNTVRIGIDAGYSFSGSTVKHWPEGSMNTSFSSSDASLLNAVYYKVYGDHAHDDLVGNYGARIASNDPLAYAIDEESNFYRVQNLDQQGNTIITNNTRNNRRKRAEDIEPFTNSVIMDASYQNALIPEFALSYYPSSSGTGYDKSYLANFDTKRKDLPKHHIGGYIATNSDGLRYVYGLPAQSKKERDVTFTVAEDPSMLNQNTTNADPSSYALAGTNKYYNSVEKGAYAHSYMLTSILGEDYVDLDHVKGASDGDLGYWVKFNYYKAHDNFKWKSPYLNVNYNRGYKTNLKDGTGNYSYGEKEIWYVATVETKTHVAEFILGSDRDDCHEPDSETGNSAGSNSYKKLNQINVYLKTERYPNGVFNPNAKPIQTCHFEYYPNMESLCKGSPDNPSGGGKLTLKKVWFTYRDNNLGATNPYIFDYYKTVTVNGNQQEVTYNKFHVDKWGNYNPSASVDNPYINPYTTKTVMDEYAALWNLKSVTLPSGGKYEIYYESDTYAYVQNEVAMQMFKIASLNPYNESLEAAIDSDKNDAQETRRVYFKLEKPIPQTNATKQKEQMRKYIREGEYLYFKVDINLTKDNGTKEMVGGYAQVSDIDVDGTSLSGTNYLWGYVQLEPLKVNGKITDYHPFTEVGARHIRYNQPEILVDNLPNADMDDLNKGTAISIATSMVSTVATIGNKFRKYTESLYGNGNDRLSHIDLDNSYLRMRTPDKVKFGGGHRVREVRIYDNWADSFTSPGEATSYYGTVYEYDFTDAAGNQISSGVATYEPLVGGDENPLRNPVKGWEDKNILAKNVANTYTEDPGNESIFPGASVGYSQVRILSTNTADKKSNFTSSPIQHYGGVTVQEFYTAKDFPIINKVTELEQNKTFRKSRLIVPAILANVDRLRMAATQGYYTELNDMHGKPKGAKELALVANTQNENGYEEQLISSVEYDYFDEEKLTTNRAGETFITRSLKNDVDILFSDTDPTNLTRAKISPGTLATDIEFIPRTQFVNKKNISGSITFNLEVVVPVPAPFFYPIPYFNWQEEKVGTVVTNKIVTKSGLLSKVTAIQKGSKVETENLVFDDLTGSPLLTTVTNDYGDKIYNYSILARDIYDRTGAAYQNIGKTAYLTDPQPLTNGTQEITFVIPGDAINFVKGDRLMLLPVTEESSGSYNFTPDPSRPKLLARYSDLNGNTLKLEVSQAMTGTSYQAVVIQSGRKNNLTTPVSSITALSNPTRDRVVITCDNSKAGIGDMANFQMRKIDNVIGISATELGEYWYKDTREINNIPSNWYDNAFYSKGFGGNFQAVRNYVYVDDRTQSANVNLRTDGVMNNVPLFNFESILAQPTSEQCKSKWRMTDQITLMNPSSAPIESKNILNTYSSSLYGRNGIEPIAVAGNAKNTEIGFESFEEYTTASVDIDANSTNNLNFYTTNVNTNAVKIENRFDMKGSGNIGTIDAPTTFSASDYNNSYVVRMHFDAYSNGSGGTSFYPKEERLIRLNASDLSISTSAGITTITFNAANPNLFNIPQSYGRSWRGEIFLEKTVPNPGAPAPANTIVFFNGKGHTGDKCIKISNPDGAAFLQRRLNLIEGKEYQFSGWFSTENNQSLQTLHNSSDYFMQPFKIEFMSASNTVISTATFKESDILQGGFVDEWQKFTLNFTMPAGAKYIRVFLPLAKEVLIGDGNNAQYALYDDLRIQPRDAEMNTYVYNNENQRLEAELDENNYATFYYYDGEGQLFLVKRETEKGIITVQESRSSINRE